MSFVLVALAGVLTNVRISAKPTYRGGDLIGTEMEWTPNPQEYGGRMKSHLVLWKELADELGQQCGASTNRDFETVSVRFEHEGDAFMRITLPNFCKDFERSLDKGSVSPDLFVQFGKRGMIPTFLSGFMERVFDPTSGVLLEDPSVECIHAIRQLTLLFGKVKEQCTPAREKAAFSAYLDAESEVRNWSANSPLAGEDLSRFKAISGQLFGNLFDSLNREVQQAKMVPKHGPGSTADRISGNRKYDFNVWTERLEQVFPSSDYLIPSARHYKRLDHVQLQSPGTEQPVRLIAVPKTMKTPRIIAMEPAHMQYAQQGILEAIRRNWNKPSNLANQFIQEGDQETNRLLAQAGSHMGHLATLDLSEASDRVPLSVVEQMLSPWPDLYDAVMASRSLTADVPGYGVLPLSKFASMGSALCFPMEAYVFLTAIFMGIEKAEDTTHFSATQISGYKGMVRVYGDDLVIPVYSAPSVVHVLEKVFPFKVNHSKSFWTGKFRESCGGDFYDGHDVSVVRVRSEFPESRADPDELVSFVSLRNQLYFGGLWKTASFLDKKISILLKGKYPTVKPTSPALGRHTVLPVENLASDRMNPSLHRPEVKAYVVSSKLPKSPLDDLGALMKWFLKRGTEPFYDKDHLSRSGRPVGVSINPRWAPLA